MPRLISCRSAFPHPTALREDGHDGAQGQTPAHLLKEERVAVAVHVYRDVAADTPNHPPMPPVLDQVLGIRQEVEARFRRERQQQCERVEPLRWLQTST
jgi:hypothetical protein